MEEKENTQIDGLVVTGATPNLKIDIVSHNIVFIISCTVTAEIINAIE